MIICELCGKKTKRKGTTHKYCSECSKIRRRETQMNYYQKPQVKARQKKHMKEYSQKPEVKAKRRLYEKYLKPCIITNVKVGTRILRRFIKNPQERERFLIIARGYCSECEYNELVKVHEKMK